MDTAARQEWSGSTLKHLTWKGAHDLGALAALLETCTARGDMAPLREVLWTRYDYEHDFAFLRPKHHQCVLRSWGAPMELPGSHLLSEMHFEKTIEVAWPIRVTLKHDPLIMYEFARDCLDAAVDYAPPGLEEVTEYALELSKIATHDKACCHDILSRSRKALGLGEGELWPDGTHHWATACACLFGALDIGPIELRGITLSLSETASLLRYHLKGLDLMHEEDARQKALMMKYALRPDLLTHVRPIDKHVSWRDKDNYF